jgi:hypothetical protein
MLEWPVRSLCLERVLRISFARLRLIDFILAVLLTASTAFADPSVLLVVQGGIDQDPAPLELRLRSELAAEGLEVVTASGRSQQNLLDLEGLARRTGAVAGLSAYVDVQSIDGRLWVTDLSSNVDLVRTLHVSRTEADPVSVFALRAVEALRGARLELEQQKRRMSGTAAGTTEAKPGTSGGASNVTNAPPPAGPAASTAPVPPKTTKKSTPPNSEAESSKPEDKNKGSGRGGAGAAAQKHWLLIGSGIMASDLNGLGMAIGPGLELRRTLFSRLSVGVAFDGPLFSKMTPRADEVVNVGQEWLEVQARWAALQMKPVSFELFGSTGVSRFAVRGSTVPPNHGRSTLGYQWVIGAGVGFGLRLTDWLSVGLDGHWLRRLPAPVIMDKNKRLTGDIDSLLLGKLGLGVWF